MRRVIIAIAALVAFPALGAGSRAPAERVSTSEAAAPAGTTTKAETASAHPVVRKAETTASTMQRPVAVKHGRANRRSSRATSEVIAAPVSFSVVNTNTSRLPCSSDGLPYEMHGTLYAPSDLPTSVTVYVPGTSGGQWQWNIEGIAGLDNLRLMALEGHASLVIDRLGQGTSGRPNGHQLCVGSEADVLHQIVQQLRLGGYLAGGNPVPRFERVAAAGHSLGSGIAELEAYSYGDVDALVLTGFGSQITAAERTVRLLADAVPRIATICPTDEDGYFYQWATPQAEASHLFFDPDPAVIDALTTLVEEASCGSQQTVVPVIVNNQAWEPTIKIPVLIMNGEHDFFFDPHSTHVQQYRYLMSPDADAVVVPDAGHTFMIERADAARIFRAVVGAWLARRGF